MLLKKKQAIQRYVCADCKKKPFFGHLFGLFAQKSD
jgi:hypothetical protein